MVEFKFTDQGLSDLKKISKEELFELNKFYLTNAINFFINEELGARWPQLTDCGLKYEDILRINKIEIFAITPKEFSTITWERKPINLKSQHSFIAKTFFYMEIRKIPIVLNIKKFNQYPYWEVTGLNSMLTDKLSHELFARSILDDTILPQTFKVVDERKTIRAQERMDAHNNRMQQMRIDTIQLLKDENLTQDQIRRIIIHNQLKIILNNICSASMNSDFDYCEILKLEFDEFCQTHNKLLMTPLYSEFNKHKVILLKLAFLGNFQYFM